MQKAGGGPTVVLEPEGSVEHTGGHPHGSEDSHGEVAVTQRGAVSTRPEVLRRVSQADRSESRGTFSPLTGFEYSKSNRLSGGEEGRSSQNFSNLVSKSAWSAYLAGFIGLNLFCEGGEVGLDSTHAKIFFTHGESFFCTSEHIVLHIPPVW